MQGFAPAPIPRRPNGFGYHYGFDGTPALSMARFRARSGEIYFEQRGARANPRVLLIHGLGCQLVQWPESLVRGLVDHGLCVVMFDNRDAGLSHGPETPPPAIETLLAGAEGLTPDYTLSDMAQDAIDLLDHLGQGGAHVVGLSMGGMIAQRTAIEHPHRVYSLTSIMSSTGNPELPGPEPEAMAAALALTDATPENAVQRHRQAWRAWGGKHYDSTKIGIGTLAERAVERACRPAGIIRQFAAITADGDRGPQLRGVTAPTLVIHGAADPLVPAAAGRDTAKKVPSARYVAVENLGHDLVEPVMADVVDAIAGHIHGTEVTR